MVPIPELWLPILVATVLVFAASNVVWMVLPHHKGDTRRLPEEAPVAEALGKQGPKPGLYRFPWASSMAEMKDPAFVDKLNKGPVGFVTVVPNGPFNMGRAMGLWVASGAGEADPAEWSAEIAPLDDLLGGRTHLLSRAELAAAGLGCVLARPGEYALVAPLRASVRTIGVLVALGARGRRQLPED